MSTITLKQIPDELHAAIKTQAKKNGRSLNKEILFRLEQTLLEDKYSPAETLAQAQQVRETLGVYLTQADLDQYKSEGRA